MRFSLIFFMVMGIIALFIGSSEGAPKVNFKAIKKGGKVIGKGFKVISAASTAHEVYEQIKNRRHG
ncbi:virescein-like [Achroia grisella]|uniref:virescein-like n=1 Tax=Achroia grisella TaxID=688607 RepID=UPI0027D31429|nr:virescein-like [Achroia grisella]